MLNELMIADDAVEAQVNEWGIINHKSLNGDISLIPRKRIDNLYRIMNGLGTHYCGRFSYISETRALRPRSGDDKFDLAVNGLSSEVVISRDSHVMMDNLFSGRPARSDLRNYEAVTLVNRFPAGFRCVDQEVYDLMKANPPGGHEWYSFMPCLVTFPVKKPKDMNGFQVIERTPISHLESMLLSMQASIKAYSSVALDNGINEVLVYPFINQGYKVGASQSRLHSQVYIDLSGSGHDSVYEALLLSFNETDGCHLCSSRHDDRLVYENDDFKLWVTNSPMRSYQLRFATTEHVLRFTDLNSRQIKSLAELLKTANLLLTLAGVTPHRNVIFNTLHAGYDTPFHFFGEIFPYESVGGFELSGQLRVSKLSPKTAAINLKKALAELGDDLSISDYTYS